MDGCLPPERRRTASAPRLRGRRGFSLIEMMVVVAIVAVVAAAALPTYSRYVHKSKRSEAFYGLRTIHDLQSDYYAQNMEYANSFEKLGAPLDAGSISENGAFQGETYTFTLTTWEFDGRAHANYRATASADLDTSDATLDIIIIENQITVMN